MAIKDHPLSSDMDLEAARVQLELLRAAGPGWRACIGEPWEIKTLGSAMKG